MSMAWETTVEDVQTVLDVHGVTKDLEFQEELINTLEDEIEKTVLRYIDMEDQTSAMLCLIEDHLIENGTVFGKKQFDLPDEDSDIEDDDDEDEDLEDSELTPEY